MSNIDLIKEYKAGNLNMKEKIIENNKGLVRKIAFRYTNSNSDDLEDYIQEGYIGVLIALDKFDIDKGIEFSTYAGRWIEQKIIRHYHNNGRSVRLTPYIYGEISKIKKTIKSLQQLNGIEPSTNEIAVAMDEDEDKIIELLGISRSIMSLDSPLDGRDSEIGTYGDIIPDKSPSPEDITVENVFNKTIRSIIDSSLTVDEQKIIKLRFGFDGECCTYSTIGKIYGVTLERIRQREHKIIWKLRKNAKIIQIKQDMHIDEMTNFHRRGHDPVLANVILRDAKRNYAALQNDHPFYRWYLKLLKAQIKIKTDIDYYGDEELQEIEFKIDAVNRALRFVMVDGSNIIGWKVVKDKLEGKQSDEYKTISKYVDYKSDEFNVINSIIDILRLNDIYVDMDEERSNVFYK